MTETTPDALIDESFVRAARMQPDPWEGALRVHVPTADIIAICENRHVSMAAGLFELAQRVVPEAVSEIDEQLAAQWIAVSAGREMGIVTGVWYASRVGDELRAHWNGSTGLGEEALSKIVGMPVRLWPVESDHSLANPGAKDQIEYQEWAALAPMLATLLELTERCREAFTFVDQVRDWCTLPNAELNGASPLALLTADPGEGGKTVVQLLEAMLRAWPQPPRANRVPKDGSGDRRERDPDWWYKAEIFAARAEDDADEVKAVVAAAVQTVGRGGTMRLGHVLRLIAQAAQYTYFPDVPTDPRRKYGLGGMRRQPAYGHEAKASAQKAHREAYARAYEGRQMPRVFRKAIRESRWWLRMDDALFRGLVLDPARLAENPDLLKAILTGETQPTLAEHGRACTLLAFAERLAEGAGENQAEAHEWLDETIRPLKRNEVGPLPAYSSFIRGRKMSQFQRAIGSPDCDIPWHDHWPTVAAHEEARARHEEAQRRVQDMMVYALYQVVGPEVDVYTLLDRVCQETGARTYVDAVLNGLRLQLTGAPNDEPPPSRPASASERRYAPVA
jgi:hypothetical protein